MAFQSYKKYSDKNVKKDVCKYSEQSKSPLNTDIKVNVSHIKDLLKGCDDVVYREFVIAGNDDLSSFVFFVDGMINSSVLNQFVLKPLMAFSTKTEPQLLKIKNDFLKTIEQNNLNISDIREIDFIEESIFEVLSGKAVLLFDGLDKGIVIKMNKFPSRNVDVSETEISIKGPKDSFIEVLRTNIILVRRRVKDPGLKIQLKKIGLRSQTDIAILYIKGIADNKIIDELAKRLSRIRTDAILDAGYIEQFIEDRTLTIFPQLRYTEKPDAVAASLYDGKISILVDNSPNALIFPMTLSSFFQSPDDSYTRSFIATSARWIRILGAAISILLPSLYIAVTEFHPGLIPTVLSLFTAATREGVPFPSFAEAFILQLVFELLREASLRLPRAIGGTVGIVGGLVIGQSAVAAGIVAPIMVIIIALTEISSFTVINYELSTAFRFIRFFLMVMAAIYGLYGIMLGLMLVSVKIVNLKSFGIPYVSPIAPFVFQDLKDSMLGIFPLKYRKKRPKHIDPRDTARQKGD